MPASGFLLETDEGFRDGHAVYAHLQANEPPAGPFPVLPVSSSPVRVLRLVPGLTGQPIRGTELPADSDTEGGTPSAVAAPKFSDQCKL